MGRQIRVQRLPRLWFCREWIKAKRRKRGSDYYLGLARSLFRLYLIADWIAAGIAIVRMYLWNGVYRRDQSDTLARLFDVTKGSSPFDRPIRDSSDRAVNLSGLLNHISIQINVLAQGIPQNLKFNSSIE
jgi:hypothetical protein